MERNKGVVAAQGDCKGSPQSERCTPATCSTRCAPSGTALRNSRIGCGGEGQGDQRFLLEVVGLGGAGGGVLAAAALGAEFVADLAAGDEDTLRVADLAIRN